MLVSRVNSHVFDCHVCRCCAECRACSTVVTRLVSRVNSHVFDCHVCAGVVFNVERVPQ